FRRGFPVARSTTFLTVLTESDLKTHTPRLPSALGTTIGSSAPSGSSSLPLQNASGSDTAWIEMTYMATPFAPASAVRRVPHVAPLIPQARGIQLPHPQLPASRL